MALQAELHGKLDASSVVNQLVGQLAGPVGQLSGVELPADGGEMDGAGEAAGTVDAAGVTSALGKIAQQLQPLLAKLPVAGDALAPLTGALDLVNAATTGDLSSIMKGFADKLGGGLAAGDAGYLSALMTVITELATAPEGQLVKSVLRAVTGLIGGGLPAGATSKLGEIPAGVDGGLRVLAGLMAMETTLAEAERLTEILAAQVDRDRIVARLDLLEARCGAMQARIGALDVNDTSAVDSIARDLETCAHDVERFSEGLNTSLGLGEATLVYMDVGAALDEVNRGAALVREADTAPTERLLAAAGGALKPLLAFDIEGLPEVRIEDLLIPIETKVGELAAAISAIDTAALVKPIADLLNGITSGLEAVEKVISEATLAVRTALEQVREVVAALPIQQIADTIKMLLDPLAAAMKFIGDLVEKIKAALELAAGTATDALGGVERAIDEFQKQIDAFFGVAKAFVDGLHLDQIAGTITDNVRAFADLLGRAQMKPYFDTACDAINVTADVVGAIPFSMLPDSMEAQVDAALKPIKDADVDAVKTEIENLLQIEDGKFALRAELEKQLKTVQDGYDQLIAAIESVDPRLELIPRMNEELDALADQIEGIQPAVTLQPVRDAIDQVKAKIQEFDLDAALEPVRDAFAEVLAKIDEYSPAKLLAEPERMMDEARAKVTGLIKLDAWRPAVDQVAGYVTSLLDKIDPDVIAARIEGVINEVRGLTALIPDTGLASYVGHFVALFLSGARLRIQPGSFAAVVDWLRGASASAALTGRAVRAADHAVRARASVAALDVPGLAIRLGHAVDGVRDAASALSAGSAKDRLLPLVSALEPQADLAAVDVRRVRFLALLDQSVPQAETLRRSGLSEADGGVTKLKKAFAPVTEALQPARAALKRIGLGGLENGIRGLVEDLLARIPPARLAGVVAPIFRALHGRLQAILDAVLVPVQDGITHIENLVAAIDLTPLREALQAPVDEVKSQIQALSPDTLLAEPLAAYNQLRAELLDFDPLGEILAILDALKALIVRVLEKLDVERILAVPLAIYDEILAALRQLDIGHVMEPVLDQLDGLAGQVDDGLSRTVTSFKKLQAALPDGGGGGGSVEVSGSVSI